MSNQEDERFQALKKRAITGYINIAETLENLASEIRSDLEAEPDELHSDVLEQAVGQISSQQGTIGSVSW